MWNEDSLNEKLTNPSQKLISGMSKISGDILILGAGGKMGPTLAILANNAIKAAKGNNKVIAVSRFTDPVVINLMKKHDIETISVDLLKPGALENLPQVPNVIYMAGRKFGTDGQEAQTWAMNTWLPGLVAEKYKHSKIVVFSSGNIYPMMPVNSGASENIKPSPVGEYAMSCLGRERMFEYASKEYGTEVFMYRLNYAVDLRYGVLHDIGVNIMEEKPVSLSAAAFNCIWQGDANEMALLALLHTGCPPVKMNITGPETVSIRYAAGELGKLLGKEPIFTGEEAPAALLNNSALAMETFGYPTVSLKTLISWQAEWILAGGRSLGKPTHFEEREGKY
ncbi:NAD-dependent epimerase/dehydratase family protein [Anaerocolumna sp.]|uniref:NAD-dependent epimerase/dehydratase family protein n=1 Tax=Anaerocolumna sp. TaxID=2041569 RepID=UPI0028AC06BF|nr:NAD-dependent epimerase/dehydratase family protein [Anaerocolumna sp.]